MSLGIIDYKFCGYGTAVSKVGDSTLYEMSKRNPWVWGALRNELYYCYITDPTTCQQIAVHVPPVPAIIRQFNLTMEEVISSSSWRKHFNDYNWQKFLSFVEDNNICIHGTFFQCVEGWYEIYNRGNASYADNTVHELFAVPQITTMTVPRPSCSKDRIYLWKNQDNIPVAGRIINRNFVELTHAYQCPSVVISVCYIAENLCAATLVNFYLCRPSLFGQDPNGMFSEAIYPVPGVDDAWGRYCGRIYLSNPWIVCSLSDMNEWDVSPLVSGTDWEFGGGPIIQVHPHPYVPKHELLVCPTHTYLPHLGSASDFNCGATSDFGESFYFFCYLLNKVSPRRARCFYNDLQGCDALTKWLVPTPEEIGEPVRVGVYKDDNGELQYLNATAYEEACCYSGYYSSAEIDRPPDYHQIDGCNVVVGTEEGAALHSKYNGCVIPSLCVSSWVDKQPMNMRWGELVTNVNVRVVINVEIVGDKESFVPTGTYEAQLKHTFAGEWWCWGLYDLECNRCFDLNPAGDVIDVTSLVESGGGTLSYFIGAERHIEPTNLAGTRMFFGAVTTPSGVNLKNFDNIMELDPVKVELPNAKFINDF